MITKSMAIRGLIAVLILYAAFISVIAAQADPAPRLDPRGHGHARKVDVRLLPGTWRYVEAYVRFDSGNISYNFTDHPQGLFIIRPSGHYSHIVMSPDLPSVASGVLKVMTDSEAHAIAENVLAHYGTWKADGRAATLTVVIEKSSFPNFDGITQIRDITKLTKTELEYVNNTVTNGVGAVVVARLVRVPERKP